MFNAFAIQHTTIERFNEDWTAGYFMIGREAGDAAGITPQAISQAATRPNNGFDCLVLGDQRYYHIAWLASRWPAGPGAQAFSRGVDAYRTWVRDNLDRPRQD